MDIKPRIRFCSRFCAYLSTRAEYFFSGDLVREFIKIDYFLSKLYLIPDRSPGAKEKSPTPGNQTGVS
jgi:hypothetical protein